MFKKILLWALLPLTVGSFLFGLFIFFASVYGCFVDSVHTFLPIALNGLTIALCGGMFSIINIGALKYQ